MDDEYHLRNELSLLFKSNEAVLHLMEDNLSDGICIWDLQQPEKEWMSPKLWLTLGYQPHEIPQQPVSWKSFMNPSDLAITMDNLEQHLQNPNYPFDTKGRYQHKNGATVWLRCKGFAVSDNHAKPLRMFAMFTDITLEKKQEAFLDECNHAAKVGYWDVDVVAGTVFWSRVTKEIHEVAYTYQPNLTDGINFYKPGYDQLLIEQLVQEAINQGTPFETELQIITGTAKLKWVRAIGQTEFVNGKCLRVYGTFQDITEEKEAKDAMTAKHQKLVNVLEGTQAGTWEWNVQTGETLFNQRCAEMLGYSLSNPQPYNMDSWYSLIHKDDLNICKTKLSECFRGKIEFYDCEYRMKHKNGEWIWVAAKGKVISWTEDGKPLMMFGTQMNITKQRVAFEQNRVFIDQAPSAIAMVDKEMRYLAASQKWLMDYCLSGRNIIGLSHYEVFPEIGEDWKTIHRDCLKGDFNQCDAAAFLRSDGTTQWISWDVRPWYVVDGEIGGLIMNTANITELKQS